MITLHDYRTGLPIILADITVIASAAEAEAASYADSGGKPYSFPKRTVVYTKQDVCYVVSETIAEILSMATTQNTPVNAPECPTTHSN